MKRMNPLHNLNTIVEVMSSTGEYFDETRYSGRSTALALNYISQAILHPYTPVKVIDHESVKGVRASVQMNTRLVRIIQDMIATLKLQHFATSPRDGTITFGTPSSCIPAPPAPLPTSMWEPTPRRTY